MFYNYYEDYQYDSCVSKGICSIGPRTSSMQEVLVMYLKLLAFYTIELKRLGGHNKDAENVIFDTISALMSNMESQNTQFARALVDVKTLLVDSKKTYLRICKERDIEPKYIQTDLKLDKNPNITELIREGEKEYTKRVAYLTPERKSLFEIMGFIIKSLSINLVELKSYIENDKLEEEGFYQILVLLNFLNYSDTEIKDILEEIKLGAKIDYKIFMRVQILKEERYGKQIESDISLSTRPNKAILVAGTNLRELEKVLEATKDKNIDIYTHGEMILAHTYPKFKEYSHLIGHFGVGIENCLLDFATFPGAILVTKHAIENIEYLYRGRLFTTDYFVPKGALKIINDDYTKLIESAKAAKGFKRGKKLEPMRAACVKTCIREQLIRLIGNIEKYKHIIIIGPENPNQKNRLYYDNLLKNLSDDTFVISFCNHKEKDNILNLNGVSDFAIIYFIINEIQQLESKKFDLSIFISKCDKHTISNLINLKEIGIKNIFLSKCTPIMLNPTLMQMLTKYYDIQSTNHPVDDLKMIQGD